MIELLTLIALWCGQPVNSTKGGWGIKTGTDISTSQVNECRMRLYECATKPGFLIINKQSECFLKEKL